jgi:hypothetical protein
MTLSILLALLLSNALQAFRILLQIGAGTGLIYILRWFWWRINAYTELTGMILSFLVALYLEIFHVKFGFEPIRDSSKLLLGVGITTAGWLIVTLLTQPENKETLRRFYKLVHPGGPGWKKVLKAAELENVELVTVAKSGWDVPVGLLCMFLGSFAVITTLFATFYFIYGEYLRTAVFVVIVIMFIFMLSLAWKKLIK